jgi:hypothetical protein
MGANGAASARALPGFAGLIASGATTPGLLAQAG